MITFDNIPQEYFLINIFTISITVTIKFVAPTAKICNLISKFQKSPIYTKSYNKRSRMFHGKLQ